MIDGAKKPTTPSLFDDFGSSRFKSKDEYKNALVSYQEALFHVQQSYYHQKKRALIVFEGWDASGKGGAIRRLTEKLDPRGVSVFPVAKPAQSDQEKHFLFSQKNQVLYG